MTIYKRILRRIDQFRDTIEKLDRRPERENRRRCIENAINKLKQENRDGNFTYITPDKIEGMLAADSPRIFSIGGRVGAHPGETLDIEVAIYNPPPNVSPRVWVHFWIGVRVTDAAGGVFLMDVDKRFAQFTQLPGINGIINPDTYAKLIFPLPIPTGIEKTAYFVNVCLMQGAYWADLTLIDNVIWYSYVV